MRTPSLVLLALGTIACSGAPADPDGGTDAFFGWFDSALGEDASFRPPAGNFGPGAGGVLRSEDSGFEITFDGLAFTEETAVAIETAPLPSTPSAIGDGYAVTPLATMLGAGSSTRARMRVRPELPSPRPGAATTWVLARQDADGTITRLASEPDPLFSGITALTDRLGTFFAEETNAWLELGYDGGHLYDEEFDLTITAYNDSTEPLTVELEASSGTVSPGYATVTPLAPSGVQTIVAGGTLEATIRLRCLEGGEGGVGARMHIQSTSGSTLTTITVAHPRRCFSREDRYFWCDAGPCDGGPPH